VNLQCLRLLSARKKLPEGEVNIGNFEYVDRPIELGEHLGNRFKVVLRSVRPKAEVDNFQALVNSSLESVKRSGFINYYGLQRVGRRLRMPRVGLAILRGDMVCG